MNRTWSFYQDSTGIFIGMQFHARSIDMITANIPEGCKAIEGHFDHLSQRIDLDILKKIEVLDADTDAEQIAALQSRLVIDYQPPQPSDDHEWSEDARRWKLKPEILAMQIDKAHALKEIERLERSQMRPMRELSMDASNEDARARVKAIDDQIAIQRFVIQRNQ